MTKHSLLVGVVILGAATSARAQTGVTRSRVVLPSHLSVGDRYYDASLPGIRAYLESVRATDADLYPKLVPDLERLESKALTAGILLAAGLAVGTGLIVYGATTRGDCPLPSASDPNFETKAAAWDACNQSGTQRTMTFAMAGLGTILAGGIGALVVAPKRRDYFDFLNRHNTVSPQPIRLQLGYDPTRRLALAGATLHF